MSISGGTIHLRVSKTLSDFNTLFGSAAIWPFLDTVIQGDAVAQQLKTLREY